MEYFIDKRVFVNGRKSHLNLHNPFNLTEYVQTLLWQYAITDARNGLNVQVGLTTMGTQMNYVELGGNLLHDTQIDGSNFSLDIINTNTISLESNTSTDIVSPDISISADTHMYLATPNINSQSPLPTLGQVLTLIDPITGECEWQDSAGGGLGQVRNGLSTNGGFAELGGLLIKDTIIAGDNYSMIYDTFTNFTITSLDRFEIFDCLEVLISGDNIAELRSENSLRLNTPNVGTQPPSLSNGQVLTLVDSVTGEAEWLDAPAGGATEWNVTISPADGYVSGYNELVLVDASLALPSATFTLKLPTAAPIGRRIGIKKTDNVLPIDLSPDAADTIDGGPTFQMTVHWEAITLVSIGTGWVII